MATSVFLTLKGRKLCGPWSDLAAFRTHPSSHIYHHYLLQVRKGSDREQPRKSGNTVFPIIRLWGFFFRFSMAANSVVGSGRISNSFELSCMLLIPVSMERIG